MACVAATRGIFMSERIALRAICRAGARRSQIVSLVVGAVLAVTMAGVASADTRTVFPIYFDWGSTTLNAKAVADVKKAYPEAKACDYNGVRVFGHADTSHTDDESAKLGMARARAVREQLMKLGLADSAIAFATKGEQELAKQTADGVKEKLNERVEIIVVCGRD
jgi:outer membrane protein OmpA-like peptidoglycan-associated protein